MYNEEEEGSIPNLYVCEKCKSSDCKCNGTCCTYCEGKQDDEYFGDDVSMYGYTGDAL